MTPSEVVDALARGDADTVRSAMDDSAREVLDSATVSATWQQLVERLGPLRSATDAVVVHDVALELERGAAHLQVAYRDDKIVGLVVREGAPTGRFGE